MLHVDPWPSNDCSMPPPPRDAAAVLLVDASTTATDAILGALASEGHDVAVLGDPDELWSAIEAVSPDVVVCAVEDGGASALDLCGELEAVTLGWRVPVMVVSAMPPSDEVTAMLLRAGADDVVGDPRARPGEVRARLQRLLRHKRALDTLRRVRREREELRREAHTDALTGTWNRRAFEAMLDQKVLAKDRLGLLFVDVDHFKKVNDVHGHDVGDAVLIQLARSLSCCVRPGDVVARLGGEEFVILLNDVGAEIASAAAERIRRKVAEPSPIEGIPSVTVSIGVAMLERGDHTSGDELVRRADAAVYAAKREGRDRVVAYRGDLPVTKESVRRQSGAQPVVTMVDAPAADAGFWSDNPWRNSQGAKR